MSGSGDRTVALVGLPRSGTTVLTALLDAHPSVCMYFEPWNASPGNRPPVPDDREQLRAWLEGRFRFGPPLGAEIIGFKETTILPESLEWTIATVDRLAQSSPVQVVWILRDPILCFFSKLEGARKWWGDPNACFSEDRLLRYLRQAGPALRSLHSLAGRRRGVLILYDALVRDPERVLKALMESLGVSFQPTQLDYYLAGPQPWKVMGDVDVAREPARVTMEHEAARRTEADQLREEIERVWGAREFAALRQDVARWLAGLPVSRVSL